MPRLVVVMGPDRGRTYQLTQEPIRIGSVGRADFLLKDTSIVGELLVQWHNDAYQVTNNLAGAIYLNNQVLNVQQTNVWYDGQYLQPSGQTKLILESGGRTTPPPEPPGTVSIDSNWVLWTLVAAGVLTGFSILNSAKPVSRGETTFLSDGAVRRITTATLNKLNELDSYAKELNIQDDWSRLKTLLAEARIADTRNDRVGSRRLYGRITVLLSELKRIIPFETQHVSKTPEEIEAMAVAEAAQYTLSQVQRIVNQRVIELAR